MKKRLYIALFAVLTLCAACTPYTKALKSTDYVYKYEMGKKAFLAGHYNSAALLLQDVITLLKGTDQAEESLFLLGMSNYNAGDYMSATTVLEKFYKSYPKSSYAEEAHYYTGMALYRSAPTPKLDQTETYEAVTVLTGFLEEFPQSQHAEEVRSLIFKLQDRLVEKEYLSAKLYYDLGPYFGNCTFGGSNYEACILTAQNALKDYPYTTLREDFSYLIAKAKFDLAAESVESKKEDRLRSAIDEYYSFVNEFSNSKYEKELKGLFKKANMKINKETNLDTIEGTLSTNKDNQIK